MVERERRTLVSNSGRTLNGDHICTPTVCASFNRFIGKPNRLISKARRSCHSMIAYGPGALLFGGHFSNSVEYLYNSSSEILEGRVPRIDSSCAVLTDRDSVILTGGVTTSTQSWEFDLVSGDWRRLPGLPGGGLYKHACTFLNRDGLTGVLIAGGSDGHRLQAGSYFYNMIRGQWTRLTDLPQPRWGARLVNVDGQTYILGGGDGRNFVKQVYQLDFSDLAWRETQVGLIYPRTDFSVVIIPAGCSSAEQP